VNHALVGRHIDAAVLSGSGQAEHVVVLIDRAAHGAQAVVTVGQGVGNGELLHAGGPCLLDNSHIGDVVGHHGIEADFQLSGVPGGVVGLKNSIGHGVFPALLWSDGCGGLGDAVHQKHALFMQRNHEKFLLFWTITIKDRVRGNFSIFNITQNGFYEKTFCRENRVNLRN